MNYDSDYFIKKFEAIPDENWCTGKLIGVTPQQHCAYGHCGVYQEKQSFNSIITEEACALTALFDKYFFNQSRYLNYLNYTVVRVNDAVRLDLSSNILNSSPKTRILGALNLIKEKELQAANVEAVREILSEQILETT